VATQKDVREIALALPGVREDDDRFAFSVEHGGKANGLAWVWLERLAPNQPRVPRPDVLAVRVANQDEKAARLAGAPEKFFTEPHYNGFPAVLVRLPEITRAELRKLIGDAWRCQAPRPLVEAAAVKPTRAGRPAATRARARRPARRR